jgi:threonine synthase
MNVGHPSNLARLVDLYGGWMFDERDTEGKVIRKGVLKEKPDMERLRRDFVSFPVTDKEVDETIKMMYGSYNTIVEPHGAVGLAAFEKANLDGLVISLETADPAKFPEKINELLNVEPEVPSSLSGLDDKEESFETISDSYAVFKEILKNER